MGKAKITKIKKPSIVAGKSVDAILSMPQIELSKLNRSEMAKVVGRLVSAGNKRIRRLQTDKDKSFALRPLTNPKTGDVEMFSTKGKDLKELQKEYVKIKNFMQNKTSTLKGWKEVKKDIKSSLKEKGVEFDDDKWSGFFDTYGKLSELDPIYRTKMYKYNLMGEIATEIDNGKDGEELLDEMEGRLKDIYEEQQEYEKQFDGTSSLFDFTEGEDS